MDYFYDGDYIYVKKKIINKMDPHFQFSCVVSIVMYDVFLFDLFIDQ